jgi:hypothetical protein
MITAEDIRRAKDDPQVRDAPPITDRQARDIAVLCSTMKPTRRAPAPSIWVL